MAAPVKPTPAELRKLARSDPALGRAMKRVPKYPGFPYGPRQSHFQFLVKSIVYQQLANAAARTIYGRVAKLTPGPAFPKPPQLLRMSDAKLRSAGLSRSKAKAIRDLSSRVERGELKLRSLGGRPDAEVIEQLTQVWGIGEWSAQMFLMFKLGRLDVMPATDLGIQEGVRRLDGLKERPTPKQVVERAEPWSPLCTVASWVLWRLVDDVDL